MCLTPDDYADDLRPPTAVGARHRKENMKASEARARTNRAIQVEPLEPYLEAIHLDIAEAADSGKYAIYMRVFREMDDKTKVALVAMLRHEGYRTKVVDDFDNVAISW